MKKIIILFLLLTLTVSCVNNRWQLPDQEQIDNNQNKDTITIVKYTF
jgi:hypothetical protein